MTKLKITLDEKRKREKNDIFENILSLSCFYSITFAWCQNFGRGYVAIYVAPLIKPSSVLNVGD